VETLTSDPQGGAPAPEPVRYIRRGDDEYADRLNHLHRPPEGLWARGPIRLPADRMIGIVGTRRATEYGRRVAHDLAADLAAEGWIVVSGLAGGIDAAAHRGALAAGGRTIGVLGCGVDRYYPVANRRLQESMGRQGLLLSEYPPDRVPEKYHFPERNRIIAALSEALVVVQAPERSGALITAKLALELGREVLAVPGPVDQAVSRGTHRLLRDGAALVESARDVIDELSGPCGRALEQHPTLFETVPAPAADEDAAGRLRAVLVEGPALADDLARRTGIPPSETLTALCRLELGGAVRSLPGHRYELVRHP
jgi:DNA processing protein